MNESPRDLLREAMKSIRARRVRTLLTSAGIALGVAAFIGSTAVAESAAAAITSRLDQVAVSTVTLRLDVSTEGDPAQIVRRAEVNIQRLEDVTGVGSSVDLSRIIESIDANPTIAGNAAAIPVLAVSAGFPEAVAAETASWDARLEGDDASQTALVGELVLEQMGMGRSVGQAVFVGGRPFEVLGLARRHAIDSRVGESVLVPLGAAVRFGWLEWGVDEIIIVVRTRPGDAQDRAGDLQLLAWPERPDRVSVTVSADPRQLRAGIESDTLLLVGGLSILLLIAGVFSIANVMFATVMERVSEIGLRRALGASERVVGVLLLMESGIIGFLGGSIGGALGVAVGLGASFARNWPTVVDPVQLAAAPFIGAVVGGLAGLYPALLAARIDPATTLRGA